MITFCKHPLGLERFFANRQRNLKVAFNIGRIMRVLLFARVLFPDSKRATYEDASQFFETIDFSLDDVYRSLDYFDRYANDLQEFLHKQMVERYGRTTDLVYYDVTNYYFESDVTDELRAKGVSKEHRPQPIVQMGLFMDKTGLPISYGLYRGNCNDCLTLMPMMQKARQTLDLGRTIAVADRGLNTSNNIAMVLAKGDGYIYGQSILRSSQALKDYCLDPAGYKAYQLGEHAHKTTFKIKSRIAPRTLRIENHEGQMVEHRIDEKQVFFYSEKYAIRARKKREEALSKAENLIANPSLYKAMSERGVQKYILGFEVDLETGEVLDRQKNLVLNETLIAEESKYDGYYVVTSSELKMSAEQIIDHYHGLWRIEENFRFTKSEFKARPVFVNTRAHINAHFLICFLALLLTRLLEQRVNHQFPLQRILSDMRHAVGVPIDSNTYVFGHYQETLRALGDAFQIDLSRKFLNKKEILQMKKPR